MTITVEERVQALLASDADLAAEVPAARIRVPGDWQNLARPYIIHYAAVAAPAIRTHDGGLQVLRIWDFYEVSVYADTHGKARQIAELVIAALDGHCDDTVDLIALAEPPKASPYDTDRKLAHVVIDFRIGGALA